MTGFETLTVARLAGFEHQLSLDLAAMAQTTRVSERRLYTYLATYPQLLESAGRLGPVDAPGLAMRIAMAYGFMPTTMNLRRGDLSARLPALRALQEEGTRLDADEFEALRRIVNNSVVGTSKLLHFLAPATYPVWDSRINRFIHGRDGPATNDPDLYRAYLAAFDRLSAAPGFEALRGSMVAKLGYEITAARAFEVIMYMSDALRLEHVPAPVPVSAPAPGEAPAPARPKVPRYKRDAYTFISTLSEVTLDLDMPDTVLRDGYLLSEHYTTRRTLALARTARARRNLLISDNGNWTRMNALGRRFSAEGDALLDRAQAEAEAGGVSDATRAARAELMARIADVCAEAHAALDAGDIIATQLRCAPDYMIGMEDFTIPVMMMAGLMHPVFSPRAEEIARYQALTRETFARQMAGDYGYREALAERALYMVIHSFDYESARAGAAAARDVRKDGIAISYGAPMKSRRWIETIDIGGTTERFDVKLPEMYIAAIALTVGTVNGHRDDVPIHVLGVGTPILIMMLGFLLKGSRAVSIDSTAPMQDAFDGRIYGTRQAFLKMDMYRLAAECLVRDAPYESRTPFFEAFEARHPSDWAGLRRALGVTAASDAREIARRLSADQALVRRHIPFFTRMRSGDDPFYWDLRVSRAGHNYMVLREIVDHVRRRRDNWPALRAWTEGKIARYEAVGSERWAMAVRKCYDLVVKYKLTDGLDD